MCSATYNETTYSTVVPTARPERAAKQSALKDTYQNSLSICWRAEIMGPRVTFSTTVLLTDIPSQLLTRGAPCLIYPTQLAFKPVVASTQSDAQCRALTGCRVTPVTMSSGLRQMRRILWKHWRTTQPWAQLAHRWKFLPSSRTTTQQWARQVSSASKSRTYSNLLFAIAAPNFKHRLKVTEKAAKQPLTFTVPAAHIPPRKWKHQRTPPRKFLCLLRVALAVVEANISLASPCSS